MKSTIFGSMELGRRRPCCPTCVFGMGRAEFSVRRHAVDGQRLFATLLWVHLVCIHCRRYPFFFGFSVTIGKLFGDLVEIDFGSFFFAQRIPWIRPPRGTFFFPSQDLPWAADIPCGGIMKMG